MIKKVLIASLFLGGGYFLIKKLLPNQFQKKEFKADTISIEEAIAEAERNMAEAGRLAYEGIKRQYGDKDLNDIKTFLFAPDLKYDDLTLEKITESVNNTLMTDEFKAWVKKQNANNWGN
tara:strand:+ start:1044 stop:1403 length:360 start_codon:yes stop_codon:yes gene_type:complete